MGREIKIIKVNESVCCVFSSCVLTYQQLCEVVLLVTPLLNTICKCLLGNIERVVDFH